MSPSLLDIYAKDEGFRDELARDMDDGAGVRSALGKQ